MAAKRRFYTVPDIAEILDIKASTVRQHIRDGKFDPDVLESVTSYMAAHRLLERAAQLAMENLCGSGGKR